MRLRRQPSFETLHVQWLNELEAQHKSADTLRAYRSDLTLWHRSGVDPDVYLLNLSGSGAKPATVNRRRAALRAYHEWLVERGYLSSNPLDRSKMVKVSRRLTRTLTVEEVARLIDGAGQLGKANDHPVDQLGHMPVEAYRARLAAMIALEVTAGLRVSEVCNVLTKNVDLDKRTVRVIRKGDKEQQLRFGMAAKRKIDAWLDYQLDIASRYLFCTKSGSAVTPKTYTRQLHEACYWAGIDPIHPHTLRHTFATLGIQNGIPVQDMQLMLGHEQYATTMLYVNRHPDRGFDRYEKHPLEGEIDGESEEPAA